MLLKQIIIIIVVNLWLNTASSTSLALGRQSILHVLFELDCRFLCYQKVFHAYAILLFLLSMLLVQLLFSILVVETVEIYEATTNSD